MEDRSTAAHRPDVGHGAAPDAEEVLSCAARDATPSRAVITEDRAGGQVVIVTHSPHIGRRGAPDAEEGSGCSARDTRPSRAIVVEKYPEVAHSPHASRAVS